MEQPTKTENLEAESPAVKSIREALVYASGLFKDQKHGLSGDPLLTFKVLDWSGSAVLGMAGHQRYKAWKQEWDAEQATVESHDDDDARKYYNAQQATLHKTSTHEGYQPGTTLTIDDTRKAYELIRESAKQRQRQLYAENIQWCREIAGSVVAILDEHIVGLEANEKARYEKYNVSYPGSPLVDAVKRARAFVLHRVSNDDGMAGPSLIIPYILA